jgi:hypothetical protein
MMEASLPQRKREISSSFSLFKKLHLEPLHIASSAFRRKKRGRLTNFISELSAWAAR